MLACLLPLLGSWALVGFCFLRAPESAREWSAALACAVQGAPALRGAEGGAGAFALSCFKAALQRPGPAACSSCLALAGFFLLDWRWVLAAFCLLRAPERAPHVVGQPFGARLLACLLVAASCCSLWARFAPPACSIWGLIFAFWALLLWLHCVACKRAESASSQQRLREARSEQWPPLVLSRRSRPGHQLVALACLPLAS